MKHLLVILQNPYDKGFLAKGWSPGRWGREFERSRTGYRLRYDLLPSEGNRIWKIHYANANPKVGQGVDAHFPADLPHLRRVLRRVQPDMVVACGQCAAAVEKLWLGPLLLVPHPAYRLLTSELYNRGREFISTYKAFLDHPGWRTTSWGHNQVAIIVARHEKPRLRLKQGRGTVIYEVLNVHEEETSETSQPRPL